MNAVAGVMFNSPRTLTALQYLGTHVSLGVDPIISSFHSSS